MQDKVEQQHLKRLVLNYEQREEAEELKGELCFDCSPTPCRLISFAPSALEARSRQGPIKIRLAG